MAATGYLQRAYIRATAGPAVARNRFGTLRGLVRLLLARASVVAGRLRHVAEPDWARVRRVVFVCTGNICRSPYAERRAAALGIRTASFALRGASGLPADPGARAAAWRHGIDLDDHLSRQAIEFELEPGDLLVGMEPRHLPALERMRDAAGPDMVQVTLLGLWSRPFRPHLHDPHRLGAAYFDTCYRVIDSGVAAIAARLPPR